MQQNTKRLISMLIALVFLVAALVMFFDYVEPAYNTVEGLKASLLANNQLLSSESTVVAKAKNLISQYQVQSQSASSSLDVAMPSGEDLAGALAQVYGLAQANSISVQAIGISSPAVASAPVSEAGGPTAAQLVKPLGTLILQVTATGSYENFKMFLSQLEMNIRLFDVKTISIQPVSQSSGKTSQDLFTYNIAATTYYQSP